MKKKLISIITVITLLVTTVIPAFAAGGDNTGQDIFTDVSMYVQFDSTSGTYNLGDEFIFKTTLYAGAMIGETATRSVTIDGPAEVTNFQYKDSDVWYDIAGYNVGLSVKNDVGRYFKVIFNEVGTYAINYQFNDGNGTVYASAKTKYVTITETSYSVSNEKPEEPTTPETTTPEEESSDDPVDTETTTPGEEPSDEPVDTETTTPGEQPSDETTTVDSNAGTTEAPTTVAPTEETSLDPALMNRPGKAKVKKATKKVTAKKLSLKLKKVKGATGYEVAVYKTKKNAKKNAKAIVKTDITKVKAVVKAKNLKNKKKLFVRVRAYVTVGEDRVTGKWSKVKKIQIKK